MWVHSGERIVRGTRVPVRSIVLSLRDDDAGDPRAVAKTCDVGPSTDEAALAYDREYRDGIDRIIDENERAAHGR